MHRLKTRALVGTLVLAATTALVARPALGDSSPQASTSAAVSSGSRHRGLEAHGLTDDGRLVRFHTNRPERAWSVGRIKGLQDGDTYLVGIDERVQDGQLYGVGDQGGVYTLSRRTARATKVSQLTAPLSGTYFGVDFNPAADRLRIVSDNGQNLSHNVNAGGTTTPQTTLTIPPATTAASGVTGAAYTNNDLDLNTVTTLFDVDTVNDQVAIQSPPASGQLAPNGKLLRDVSGDVGFDIYSRLEDGVVVGNRGFTTFASGSTSRLARVALLTGAADDQGRFPRGMNVVDLAVALDQ